MRLLTQLHNTEVVDDDGAMMVSESISNPTSGSQKLFLENREFSLGENCTSQMANAVAMSVRPLQAVESLHVKRPAC